MFYCNKPKNGQTIVQRIAPIISESASEVLELRHALCGNRKICVRSEMLQAHLTLNPGVPFQQQDGTYVTEIQVAGKLLYQPVAGCYPPGFNPQGCPANNCCKPCPEEDVIFASYKVYTTSPDFSLESCSATVYPITQNPCQDFTSQVLIALPYELSVAALKRTNETPKLKKEV